MLDQEGFPRILPVFDSSGSQNNQHYTKVIQLILKHIIPDHFFIEKEGNEEKFNDVRDQFLDLLPHLHSKEPEIGEKKMSFYLLSKYRPDAFKFFFDMISGWLVPGKRLNVLMIYAVDFKMPDLSDDVFTICDVMVEVANDDELEAILRNLPIIEMEIKLGVVSAYHAGRIRESKGISSDEKVSLINAYLAQVVQRFPETVGFDIFTEMQHVLVMCRDDFKRSRGYRLLSKIICTHYLFRKWLLELVKEMPERRHLRLKLFRFSKGMHSEGRKVLGVVVGINFLRAREVFEERHLLSAIQNYIPNVNTLRESFFANRRGSESICTLYLEIAKDDGSEFTFQEIQRLRHDLPSDLKDRIEHLMHPVFMPRNEEEIMRNILSLSGQIKYLRDIPQVFISFDEQTHQSLFFSVIIVRVLMPGVLSIQEMFKKSSTFLGYIHDRCKTVGFLRKRYPKEATVFRVKLRKDKYLRVDHSIDLYKARQAVMLELIAVVGDLRDFNGGMISKQNELLCAVRDLLSTRGKAQDYLLENFFYSLSPVVMRSVLEPITLKKLFLLFLEVVDEGFSGQRTDNIKIRNEQDCVYAVILSTDPSLKEEIGRLLSHLNMAQTEIGTAFIHVYDNPCLGYIYRTDDPYKQEHFRLTLQQALSV